VLAFIGLMFMFFCWSCHSHRTIPSARWRRRL